MKKPLTLKNLQKILPWTVPYSKVFQKNKSSKKDFQHALIHVFKSAGILAAICEKSDHDEKHWETVFPFVADLVICSLRMANTNPSGPFDLEATVRHRLESKNKVQLAQLLKGIKSDRLPK